jgi:hypothetical protein
MPKQGEALTFFNREADIIENLLIAKAFRKTAHARGAMGSGSRSDNG